AAPAGSPFFCVDLLEHLDVEVSLGQQLLESGVLQLQRLQALDVVGLHLPEVLAPGVDGCIADLVLLGSLGHAGAVCLTQHGNHLLFSESTLSHGLLAGWDPSSQESMERRNRAGHPDFASPSVRIVVVSNDVMIC